MIKIIIGKYSKTKWNSKTKKYYVELGYERDFYTCQCCNQKGGNLNAHHIINFADNEDSRFDIENGITLCVKCHSEFHKIYGRKDNDVNQLETFISNKVKTYAELTGIEL